MYHLTKFIIVLALNGQFKKPIANPDFFILPQPPTTNEECIGIFGKCKLCYKLIIQTVTIMYR